ncbi:hypothetical protein B0O99DRAFT_682166 [Bisporella sp. PMI_857]|nr:hypothetical protein B0O99DRAFT_504187 [Bisporella sp. PMI_857]KAH8600481.1 hypothetical protein B0O99DRAFT_682166 [Bisporella sp. PMI_857]
MLDENLPTFYTKPSSDNPLSSTLFLSENGNELQPEYTLWRPDPQLPASNNCYGLAIFDSHNPDVLYAEVNVRPEWTQPTLSQAEIRAQNGVPPPPVPIVPTQFTIQLYNPDMQVIIRQIPGTWKDSAYWEFDMPQSSFRQPSASALDRSKDDPAASDITPKVHFKWRKDGKLSKDISCYLSGQAIEGRKNKEPDIPVAMYKDGRALTIYQPNMHRVDVEDTKGLEVVFLLGAAVIKDIFFNPNREMFNISSPTTTTSRRKNSGPVIAPVKVSSPVAMSGAIFSAPSPSSRVPSSQIPQNTYGPPQPQQTHYQQAAPPATDPQKQWEIDAETARLKVLVEKEQKEREKRDREEQKRIKKMLEAEEKERKRREAEVAKETERLRKQYGVPGSSAGPRVQFAPSTPPRPQPLPQIQQPNYQASAWGRPQMPQHHSAPNSRPTPAPRPLSTPSGPPNSSVMPNASLSTWLQRPQKNSGPYLQAPGSGTASSSGFFGLGGKKLEKKRSVFF